MHRYNVDNTVEIPEDGKITTFWNSILNLKRYPLLCRGVCALLSIITAPKVESMFSVMNSVLGEHSTKLNIETVSMIQTIKYYLKSRNTTAVENFDPLQQDYVIPLSLYDNMRMASMKRITDIQSAKRAKQEELESINMKAKALLTKRKAKLIHEEEAKRSRVSFYKEQRRAILHNLVAKRSVKNR